ncbi:MAG: ISL3 family transposase [Planctomycetota bacterium]
MRDTELYRHLLGLVPPWTVARVELNVKEQKVDVWAEHDADQVWCCPECGESKLPLYDHSEERTWRHLDSCQFLTFLHARPPRVSCPTHGVRQARLPWAEPRSRFTALFERLAIDVLKETSITGGLKILRISWDEAWHILQRAVERGLRAKPRRLPAAIGVDEKAAAKGHVYVTIVCDLERGTVEGISDGRKKEDLDRYFAQFTEEERKGVEAVALDMWDPYIASVVENIPDGRNKIVFDRFHVMKNMGEAVNNVRKGEHRELRAEGDETLVGSKYLWLYNEENLPEKHNERFNALRKLNLRTARAWAIKESLRDLWSYQTERWGMWHWRRWYNWATHSQLKPVIAVAKMMKRRLANVMTYFTHRITNAVSEGLNSKIQTIKKKAYGYRNRDHFKTAILFHCGGLDLYPTVP